MQIDTIVLSGKDLAEVDNVFASVRPKFAKQVTLNYTDGKRSDARWEGQTSAIRGLTRPSDVHVVESKATCTASVLIDLYAVLTGSVTPAWSLRRDSSSSQRVPATLSPAHFRLNTVATVVHELVHVFQGWQFAKRWAHELLDEKISVANRLQEHSQGNPIKRGDAYLENTFESSARDFTHRWMQAHAQEIHSGSFNFLLPMITMRGIFPDVRDVYK